MSQQNTQRSVINFSSSKIVTVIATTAEGEAMTEISYTDTKVIGNGSFGVVFQAKILPSNDLIAIKKVLQDRRFKNRELQIMRKCKHINVVKLMYFFYSSGEKRDEVYLNLVLEFIPETLYKIERQYARSKQTVPVNFVRLYMYQLFRSLAYIHSIGVCHRDIKPQNLLLDSESGVLKLCDFGSAKQLEPGEPNVSYICSRYYRAPELIFGSVNYTTKIDMWSAGCVVSELLLGQLIFPGDSGVDQIVEIVKVMGTPSAEQLQEMNPNYKTFKLPLLKPHPWQKVFRIRTPAEAIDLVSKLLIYTPNARLAPIMACAHPFFDELRHDPKQTLPNGRPLPPLFNFTEQELALDPNVTPLLMPKTTERHQRKAAGADTVQVECHPPSPRAQRKSQTQQKLQFATLPEREKQHSVLQQQPQTSSPQKNLLQVSQLQQQPQQQQQESSSRSTSSRGVGTHAHRPETSRNPHTNILTLTLQDIGNGDGVNMTLPNAPCENVATATVSTGPQNNNNIIDDNEPNDLILDTDDDSDCDNNDDDNDNVDVVYDDDDDDDDDDDENVFNVNYSSGGDA